MQRMPEASILKGHDMKLEEEIILLLSREVPGELTLDTTLEDKGIDSLRAISILYNVEDQFEIEIPNDVIERIKTIGDIVDAVRAKVSA